MSRAVLILVALLAFSCHPRSGSQEKVPDSDSVTTSNLIIEKGDDYTRITVSSPWQNSRGMQHTWYLIPHGGTIPEGTSEAQVIFVPVRRIVCMSTTHVAMMRALEADTLIAAISGSSLIYDPVVRTAVSSGRIRDVGYEANLDKELIISMAPDLVMAYGIAGPVTGSMARLTETGVKVFYNSEHMETHPLARCEWIRLFGLLTGKEAMADSIVEAVSSRYHELTAMVRESIEARPVVLMGAPWEDVWYISPADSYTGRLIADAGGEYLYSDLKGPGPAPMSVESVFRRAAEAEIWINPGDADRLADIAAADHRLAALPLFSSGRVWNNRQRITPEGGNDYWESAVVRPDRLLGDLISIIHPELMPGYEQYYYRRLQ